MKMIQKIIKAGSTWFHPEYRRKPEQLDLDLRY